MKSLSNRYKSLSIFGIIAISRLALGQSWGGSSTIYEELNTGGETGYIVGNNLYSYSYTYHPDRSTANSPNTLPELVNGWDYYSNTGALIGGEGKSLARFGETYVNIRAEGVGPLWDTQAGGFSESGFQDHLYVQGSPDKAYVLHIKQRVTHSLVRYDNAQVQYRGLSFSFGVNDDTSGDGFSGRSAYFVNDGISEPGVEVNQFSTIQVHGGDYLTLGADGQAAANAAEGVKTIGPGYPGGGTGPWGGDVRSEGDQGLSAWLVPVGSPGTVRSGIAGDGTLISQSGHDYSVLPAPEPASFAVVGFGLLCLRRRRSK